MVTIGELCMIACHDCLMLAIYVIRVHGFRQDGSKTGDLYNGARSFEALEAFVSHNLVCFPDISQSPSQSYKYLAHALSCDHTSALTISA
jgi:hypothetical protein